MKTGWIIFSVSFVLGSRNSYSENKPGCQYPKTVVLVKDSRAKTKAFAESSFFIMTYDEPILELV